VRYATLKGIMPRRKKKSGDDARIAGVSNEPTQKIEKFYVPTKPRKPNFDGTPKEVATKLVEKLKFEARVI